MKKFTAILTAIVIALFLVSCGGSSKKENEQETPDGDETPDTGEEEDDGDDNGDENACKLDKDLLTLDTAAERYLAFKGIGILNPSEPSVLQNRSAQPATQVKFDAAGMAETSFPYATSYSFYDFGYSANYQENLVTLTIVGDVTEEGYIKTIAFVAVPISYVDYMKQNEVYELAQAPMTQVLNLKRSNDGKYMQQCLFASKVINNQYVSGKMKICYDNKELAVGGTFKMSMVSEIASDQETVDTFTDINSLDDLCSCYDLTVESDNDEDARVSCEGIDWNKAAEEEKPEEKDPCKDVKCPTEGDVCVADATVADKGYKCEPKATCDAEKNEVLNEKTNKCDCKEGFELKEGACVAEEKDPCKDITCPTEGDVCVADATVADKGYKCEPKKTCDAEKNEVLNEKTNTCDCKEGFELKEGKCEKKEDAPAPTEAETKCKAATGTTWDAATSTCTCTDTAKTWNGTECAAPANPEKEACDAYDGATWNDNKCVCDDDDKDWNDGACVTNEQKAACNANGAASWVDGACVCEEPDYQWTGTECIQNPPANPDKEVCDAYDGATWNDENSVCECDNPALTWTGTTCADE